MSRMLFLCALAGSFCVSSGCANFVETRTLNKFATALEEGDLETLKANSSDNFDEKALRLEESLEDFKRLRIPTKGIEIVSVKDVSESEKHIKATVEDTSKPIFYKLVLEEGTRHWVIDDIVLERQKGSVTVEKNVSEQIDLYLSVREFLKSWKSGNRTLIESHMTPKMAGLMKSLPDAYFKYLNKKVTAVDKILNDFSPRATIDDDLAVVQIKRKTGILGIVMKFQEDGWLVRDMAIEGKEGDHITSLSKAADSMRSAATFLNAYQDQDKARLEKITASNFFKNTLQPGDITTVSLPGTKTSGNGIKLRMPPRRPESRQRIDMEIPHGNEIVTVTLRSVEKDEEDWKKPGFEVADIKMIDKNNLAKVRKLSSVLTAEARVRVFHEAFVSKDLPVLKYASSFDFNRRVWDRLNDDLLPMVQVELPQDAEFAIESINYDGEATEVLASQGNTPVAYILREHDGELRVDDVELPMPGRPNSFKKFMDIAMPVYYFAYAIEQATIPVELEQVNTEEQRQQLGQHFRGSLLRFETLCSFDFNHQIWQSTEVIPGMVYSSLQHLDAPITLIESPNEKVHWVTLGDQDWGARVKVIQEREANRIAEIKLIAGIDTEADLKLLVQDELNRNGRSLRALYPLTDENMLANELPPGGGLLEEPARFGTPEGAEIQQVSGWEEIEVDFPEESEETAEAFEPLFLDQP